MTSQNRPSFDPQVFLKPAKRKSVENYSENQVIFSQGDVADAIFYLQKGWVKVSIATKSGYEMMTAILRPGDFFGEESIAGQALRTATVTTMCRSSILRLEKSSAIKLLEEDPAFAETFLQYLLSRNSERRGFADSSHTPRQEVSDPVPPVDQFQPDTAGRSLERVA